MASVEGWDEFKRKWAELNADYESRPKIAVMRIAAAIEGQAKKNASTGKIPQNQWKTAPHIPSTGPGPNVRSGNLRNNIFTYSYPSGYGIYKAEVGVGSGVVYARAVEKGASNWHTRSDGTEFPSGEGYPYFTPAVKEIIDSGAVDLIYREVFRGMAGKE